MEKLTYKVHCKRELTVKDLESREDLMLITDSQDRKALEDHFGNPEWMDYGCYFVEVVEGDYGDVYGCESSVPHLSEYVDTIWGELS